MGAVDLVIQVESPGSVASGLQRIGRAGHQVGEPSAGKIFPKFRGDLLETRRRRASACSTADDRGDATTRATRSTCSRSRSSRCARSTSGAVDDLCALVRRAANFADLSDDVFVAVLDLLAGRYPVRRVRRAAAARRAGTERNGVVRAREGAGATRHHDRRHDPGPRPVRRVPARRRARRRARRGDGVREPRPARCFVLGASTWRIEEITRDRVVVTPAPGEPGKMPFWKGDKPGRPLELGRALGAFTRELALDAAEPRRSRAAATTSGSTSGPRRTWSSTSTSSARPPARSPTTARSSSSGSATSSATGGCASSRRSARGCTRRGRSRSRSGCSSASAAGAQVLWSDDGIVLRLPEAVDAIPLDDLLFDPDEIEASSCRALPGHGAVRQRVPRGSARARCCSPGAGPGQRTPLWQQRQRSADLLGRGREATRRSRSCWRRRASACATSSTCRRCARC